MFKTHVFVCTNAPDVAGKCGNKNSQTLHQNIKEACKGQPWAQNIRINKSGCLGHCEKGIAAVAYPQSKWFFNLTDQDGSKMIQEIKTICESENGK